MFQKTTSSLLLICALLFAQLVAVQHQGEHFADFLNKTNSHDEQTGELVCEQCVNQSDLSHALACSSLQYHYLSVTRLTILSPRLGFHAQAVLSQGARAPPFFA